ncbi:MAG: histidine phosphatase family protein [Chloroflexi bacterium]|nr:histidine phosphatase family protein [Chloroflexota bacterium]
MTLKRLLLLRHGETTGNIEERCQGQADVLLTARGRDQVARVAARLVSEQFDAIYASDLRRTAETAAAVAAPHGLPVRLDARLREMSKGVWDGMRWDDIRHEHAAEFAAWQADRDFVPPGGEPLSQVVARLETLLADLRRDHAGQTVLLVAHGATLRTLICLVLAISPEYTWHFHLDNTGLAELVFEPEGAVLTRLNDTCHLLA